MSSSSIVWYLPFRRVTPAKQERVEDALREVLRAHPGVTFEVADQDIQEEDEEEDLEVGLELRLSFPAAAGRRAGKGTLVLQGGDEDLPARLVLENDNAAPASERMSGLGAALAERLGGWAEGEDHEARLAALDQGPLRAWEEVVACADDHYMVSMAHDGWCTVLVNPEDLVDVSLELFEEQEGARWLVLRSVVGPEGMLEPKEALEANAVQDFASLALNNDLYELVYSFPLEALTGQALRDLLAWMAEEALDLREEHVR